MERRYVARQPFTFRVGRGTIDGQLLRSVDYKQIMRDDTTNFAIYRHRTGKNSTIIGSFDEVEEQINRHNDLREVSSIVDTFRIDMDSLDIMSDQTVVVIAGDKNPENELRFRISRSQASASDGDTDFYMYAPSFSLKIDPLNLNE